MSAKVVPCICPVCKTEFHARHDQIQAAIDSNRGVPCCSYKCDRERRYAKIRDEKWKVQVQRVVNGFNRAK